MSPGAIVNTITRVARRREATTPQRSRTKFSVITTLAVELAQTARMWGRAVAPFAEWVARTLWSNSRNPTNQIAPPTRLTQRHKREAKGAPSLPPAERGTRRHNLCRGCGKTIRVGRTHCGRCAIDSATERIAHAARIGRVAARTPEARAKQGAARRRHAQTCSAWDASTQPAWLTDQVYSERIQPLLAHMSSSAIASRIGVSRWYAGRIRHSYRPHPRHWLALAQLVGTPESN